MMDDLPDGWYVPIQRSLTKPDLIGGVPWGFGVLIGTWTLALTLGAQKFWTAGVGLGLYFVGVAAIKMDPHFFDVLKEHMQTKGYYGV
jgi:type IV secretion system protein TrbD